MKRPRLIDSNHILVKICNCGEQSLTLDECRDRRDHLEQAIRRLEYNQDVRKVPNTVHCNICGTPGKETQTQGLDGVLWGLGVG